MTWKLLKADELEVEVPLKDESAGPVLTLVAQSGLTKADEIPMQMYSEAAHLDHFELNAGDQQGVLIGTRLDEVASLQLDTVSLCSRERYLVLTGKTSCTCQPRSARRWPH